VANQIVNSTIVLQKIGFQFAQSLQFCANIDRQYSDEWSAEGAKKGATVSIRLPNIFTPSWGEALAVQDILERTVSLTLNRQVHVDTSWSSALRTTDIDMVSRRYTEPAAQALAAAVDSTVFAAVYPDVYNSVGTPGTTPTDRLTYLQAGVKLTDLGTNRNGRVAVLDSLAMANLANTNMALFNPSTEVSSQMRDGSVAGKILGVQKWFEDENRPVHTTGTYTASTPKVNGASQTGSSLISDGWASGATSLKKGDVFTVASVYSVHPISKVSTGRLQQFVLTADISDTTGAITLPISPSIVTSGALQNVNAGPADNAVITVLGTTAAAGGTLTTTNSPQSMVYHPTAFALGTADLYLPTAGCSARRIQSPARGIALRMVEQFDIQTDQNPTRIDFLFGEVTVNPGFAARVWG